jgi:hypothetical protein
LSASSRESRRRGVQVSNSPPVVRPGPLPDLDEDGPLHGRYGRDRAARGVQVSRCRDHARMPEQIPNLNEVRPARQRIRRGPMSQRVSVNVRESGHGRVLPDDVIDARNRQRRSPPQHVLTSLRASAHTKSFGLSRWRRIRRSIVEESRSKAIRQRISGDQRRPC